MSTSFLFSQRLTTRTVQNRASGTLSLFFFFFCVCSLFFADICPLLSSDLLEVSQNVQTVDRQENVPNAKSRRRGGVGAGVVFVRRAEATHFCLFLVCFADGERGTRIAARRVEGVKGVGGGDVFVTGTSMYCCDKCTSFSSTPCVRWRITASA